MGTRLRGNSSCEVHLCMSHAFLVGVKKNRFLSSFGSFCAVSEKRYMLELPWVSAGTLTHLYVVSFHYI